MMGRARGVMPALASRAARGWCAGLLCALACGAQAQTEGLSPSGPPPLHASPNCNVPFPRDALEKAPAGFKGEALVLVSFTVRGEFRSARLLQSSGNEMLDQAALRAAVRARCQDLGDRDDPALQEALIGIPFAYTFDRTRH